MRAGFRKGIVDDGSEGDIGMEEVKLYVQRFWADVLEQNADRLSCYFHDDAVIRWPCTNEQFTVSEYIKANCLYPGKWDGEIERIMSGSDIWITVCRVWSKEHRASFHVVTMFRMRAGRIAEMDEVWGDDGPAPQWRQDLHIGQPIRNLPEAPRREK